MDFFDFELAAAESNDIDGNKYINPKDLVNFLAGLVEVHQRTLNILIGGQGAGGYFSGLSGFDVISKLDDRGFMGELFQLVVTFDRAKSLEELQGPEYGFYIQSISVNSPVKIIIKVTGAAAAAFAVALTLNGCEVVYSDHDSKFTGRMPSLVEGLFKVYESRGSEGTKGQERKE